MAGMIANCKSECFSVVAAFAAVNAESRTGARRGEHLYNRRDVLISPSGKHRGNSPSEAKIQRHEFDRVVVYGIVWLRSDDG